MEEDNQNQPAVQQPDAQPSMTPSQKVNEMEKQVPNVPDQPDQIDQNGKKLNDHSALSPEKDRKVIIYVLIGVVGIGIVVGLLYYFFIAETGTGFIGDLEEEGGTETEVMDDSELSEDIDDEDVVEETEEELEEELEEESDPFSELFGEEVEEEIEEEMEGLGDEEEVEEEVEEEAEEETEEETEESKITR